jgi:hypothetical protein
MEKWLSTEKILASRTLKKKPKVGDPDYRHPYTEYESTPLWNALWKGVSDLVGNLDLVEKHDREYIVGYLCKTVTRSLGRTKQ